MTIVMLALIAYALAFVALAVAARPEHSGAVLDVGSGRHEEQMRKAA